MITMFILMDQMDIQDEQKENEQKVEKIIGNDIKLEIISIDNGNSNHSSNVERNSINIERNLYPKLTKKITQNEFQLQINENNENNKEEKQLYYSDYEKIERIETNVNEINNKLDILLKEQDKQKTIKINKQMNKNINNILLNEKNENQIENKFEFAAELSVKSDDNEIEEKELLNKKEIVKNELLNEEEKLLNKNKGLNKGVKILDRIRNKSKFKSFVVGASFIITIISTYVFKSFSKPSEDNSNNN